MPALSSLALALTLGGTPAASPSQMSLPRCREAGHDFFMGYGSAQAPARLEVYVDPTNPGQLQLWLEARRLAGEREGELRIELVVARGGLPTDERGADGVRRWFMAVAELGATEDALRLIESRGWERVARELAQADSRRQLAEELGVEPERVDARLSGASEGCLTRRLDRDARALAALTMAQPATVVGIVNADGELLLQYVDLELAELRPQLDRALRRSPANPDASSFIPFGPSLGGQSSRLDQTFPETGVLVGGRALPHRLLIFVEDEEHGALPHWLAPAMRFRGDNPGRLSVQLIAAGVGARAIRLRRRLCAARLQGLEVEFLTHLALRPAARRLHETELDTVLQPLADSEQCSDSEALNMDAVGDGSQERKGSDFGHPRGAWLDGRPISRGDLETLEWQLGASAQASLIDWVLQPHALSVFEF